MAYAIRMHLNQSGFCFSEGKISMVYDLEKGPFFDSDCRFIPRFRYPNLQKKFFPVFLKGSNLKRRDW